MVLEDLHWADEATLDVLRCCSFGGMGHAGCILLLATYRDDAAGPGSSAADGARRAAPAGRRNLVPRVPPLSEAAVERRWPALAGPRRSGSLAPRRRAGTRSSSPRCSRARAARSRTRCAMPFSLGSRGSSPRAGRSWRRLRSCPSTPSSGCWRRMVAGAAEDLEQPPSPPGIVITESAGLRSPSATNWPGSRSRRRCDPARRLTLHLGGALECAGPAAPRPWVETGPGASGRSRRGGRGLGRGAAVRARRRRPRRSAPGALFTGRPPRSTSGPCGTLTISTRGRERPCWNGDATRVTWPARELRRSGPAGPPCRPSMSWATSCKRPARCSNWRKSSASAGMSP